MSLSKENKVTIDGQTYYGGLNQPNLKFIKLNVDCWEKIFDLLSLRDILAMSQTCQRMRQIGGHYFRENFHGTACKLTGSSSGLYISIANNPMERVDFLRFIDTIEIDNLRHLRTASSMGLLTSLTTLSFWPGKRNFVINEHQLQGLENIQNSIETIELHCCSIDDNSVGEFLASCPKLKSLRFTNVNYKSKEVQAGFFQHTYPMLDHVKFVYCEDTALELPSFLERNPSIKCLETDANNFLQIPLYTSTVQLDYLNISLGDDNDFKELFSRLKALHAKGFYKKLRLRAVHLDNSAGSEMFMREMTSFSALEVFYTLDSYTDAINHMSQLKELHLDLLFVDDGIDSKTMAMNLKNLERLCIHGTLDQFLPFLRHARKLKFIIFYNSTSDYSALNLNNLNELRKMSGMQRKLQIGLHEQPYLATKWKWNDRSYDFVEITRADAIRRYFDY